MLYHHLLLGYVQHLVIEGFDLGLKRKRQLVPANNSILWLGGLTLIYKLGPILVKN